MFQLVGSVGSFVDGVVSSVSDGLFGSGVVGSYEINWWFSWCL